MRTILTLMIALAINAAPAATLVGPDTVLPINHSYLDQSGNPETLSVFRLRVLDGSSNVLDSIEVAAEPSPGPTNAPLGGVIDFAGAAGATVTLQIRAVDSAGNDGNWITYDQITIDNTPPADPTFGTPFDGSP